MASQQSRKRPSIPLSVVSDTTALTGGSDMILLRSKRPRKDLLLSHETSSVATAETLESSDEPASGDSSVTSSTSERHDENWSARLEELRHYKETHGHCQVPKKLLSNPQLGIWVMNQRAQYKLLREGKPSTMTPERIESLESVGFVWSLCDHVDWESRFEELRQYRTKHGNCLVPNKFPENPQLGTWVNKQRTQYKLLTDGKPSSMTEERVKALESLGFVWSKRDLVDWESRLEELRNYKRCFGDCLVPNKYSANPQLGTWVMHQRAQYRKWKEGKASPMTIERVTTLESLGFVWSISNHDNDWGVRLEELRCYKLKNGHCRVPNKFSENPKLGSWVSKQRKQYKLAKMGKASTLTPDRIATLEAEGFVWSLRSLVDWEARLQELREYKRKHGDCLVPQQYADNPQLGTWVSNQRKQYRLLKEGKPSPLTQERVSALEALGFVWSIFQHDDPWDTRLSELKSYLRKYGDCLVPDNFMENPQLATWVKHQRKQYEVLKSGKKSSLTKERFLQLEAMGFAWCPSEKRDSVVLKHNTPESCNGTHHSNDVFYLEKSRRKSLSAGVVNGRPPSPFFVTPSLTGTSQLRNDIRCASIPDTFSPVSVSHQPVAITDHCSCSQASGHWQWSIPQLGQQQVGRTRDYAIPTAVPEEREWEPLPHVLEDTVNSSPSSTLAQSPSSSDWGELFDPIFTGVESGLPLKKSGCSSLWDLEVNSCTRER